MPRGSKSEHGHKLQAEVAEIKRLFERPRRVGAIEPALIFKVEMHPQGYLDEDRLDRMGLQVLARDPDKTLVVFASDEDLTAFQRHLESYAGDVVGPGYGEIGGIERLAPLTREDRTGIRLRDEPLESGALRVPLDVELWHPGTAAGAERTVAQLVEIVEALEGQVTDHVIGSDLLLARVRLDADRLDELLEVDRVREVDRIPRSGIAPTLVALTAFDDLPNVREPEEDSPGIVLVDSGITANHPLLSPLVGDAAAFPGPSVQPPYSEADTEQVMGGHGTSVAGIAGYGSVEHAVQRSDATGVRLFSARVLDDSCAYDPDELVEHQLETALDYFLDEYPECRVINISLGDTRLIMTDTSRQFRLAARIDELAHEHQSRNILFVISSGNFDYLPFDPGDEIRRYPDYLLEWPARIIDPASAALALTVGGLATGASPENPGRRAVAANARYPSPFTRTGPGLNGMVKPDVVEFAGDSVLDASDAALDDDSVGVLTTNRSFGPPDGRLLRQVRGTSFAAPAVSHLAARLYGHFPDATPNLIRALIADSSVVPQERPPRLAGRPWDEHVWRVFGNGQPDLDRAAFSAENDVLLTAESTIGLDAYQLFEIPELPEDFLGTAGDRSLCVSLAYDPPTRQTRGTNYLGVGMQFRLFRNLAVTDVERLFRDWNRAPAGPTERALEQALGDVPASAKVDLKPGANVRGKGTLQKGSVSIARANWQYDGGPLVLAVTSQRVWAPEEVVSQRFAVVASLKHSDQSVRLHSRLRQRLRARARVQT